MTVTYEGHCVIFGLLKEVISCKVVCLFIGVQCDDRLLMVAKAYGAAQTPSGTGRRQGRARLRLSLVGDSKRASARSALAATVDE